MYWVSQPLHLQQQAESPSFAITRSLWTTGNKTVDIIGEKSQGTQWFRAPPHAYMSVALNVLQVTGMYAQVDPMPDLGLRVSVGL